MNWIQKAGARILRLKAAQNAGGFRAIIKDGTVVWVKDNAAGYLTDGYQGNDIVYAACKLITDKMKGTDWNVYRLDDESSLKQAKAIERSGFKTGKDYKKYVDLKRKALTLIDNPDYNQGKLAELLKWPNEEQSFQDLVEGYGVYMLITGNNYLYAHTLEAGASKGLPYEFHILPSQYTDIIAVRGFPARVVGYQLNNGEVLKFGREKVMHTKFFNPDFDYNGSHLVGQSPLQAAKTLLTTNNEGKKATASAFVNGGASSIIYIDDTRVDADQALEQIEAIKATWAKEYTGSSNWNKKAMSGYKAGVAKVGDSVKEMALVEMEHLHLQRLFNIWGIPSQLGNDNNASTFSNVTEAGKALTVRCALPRLITFRDNFNRMLQKHWGFPDGRTVIDYDMTAYPELQVNVKEIVESYTPLFDRGLLTGNELRHLANMEETTDEMHNKYFITGNYMPIEEMGQNPVDEALNDENANL